jgi:hypothetical protein
MSRESFGSTSSYWPDDCIPDPKLRAKKPGRPGKQGRKAQAKRPAPRCHPTPAEKIDPQFFEWLKAAAMGNARHCARRECRQRGRCCGGPRGIAALRGIPLCWPGKAGEDWARGEIAGLIALRGERR